MERDFRGDIEGLRAFAVLPVVLFHLDPAWCPGGFAGVDIFFVISGYLITRIILAEGAAFDLRAFYVRRFFRLYPALQAVLIATLIAGWFVLGPADYARAAWSAFAAAFAVSNIWFWQTIDYFNAATHAHPLLHTWSLGVEEQFYLVWPALLIFAQRRGWSLLAAIGGAGVLSLMAIHALQTTAPEAVFYLMPFRVVELALGASLVRLEAALGAAVRSAGAVVGAIGMALLALTFAALDSRTPWPGLWALMPVVGAGLLILGGRDPLWQRVLANPVARYIGRISYSVYLVHWPLVTLYRTYLITEPSRLELIVLGVGSIVLGALLYAMVEVPFRLQRGTAVRAGGWPEQLATRLGFRRIASFLRSGAVGVSFAALMTGTLAVAATGGFPSRLDKGRVQLSDGGLTFAGDLCSFKRRRCVFGDPDASATVYLVGDSHALNLLHGLDGLLREMRLKGIALYDHGCLFALGTKRFTGGIADEQCRKNVAEAYALLAANRSPVILAGSFAGYSSDIGTAEARAPLSAGIAEYYAFVEERLAASLALLGPAARPVIVVKQTYSTGVDLPRCLSQPGGDEEARRVRCAAQTRTKALEQAALADRLIERLAARFPGVVTIDPKAVFCAAEACTIRGDAGLYFRDTDHLTNAGSTFLIASVRETLLKALRGKP